MLAMFSCVTLHRSVVQSSPLFMSTYEQRLDLDFQLALREGDMFFQGDGAVQKTLRRIAERLTELEVDYAIAGGMALYSHGFRRYTEDVDVLVTAEGLAKIHAELEGLGYVRPFAASKNLRDAETGVRIDFLVSGQFPGDGKPGPVAFPVPLDASIEQHGFRVISLPKLVELKLASGQAAHRLKDLADVQELVQHLKLPLEFAEQLDPSLRDAFRRIWTDAQAGAGDEY
jgi:hypothetical protein